MNILIVNTAEKTGGAAIAARRLMEALNANGVKARMLVRDKQSDHLCVSALPRSPWLKMKFLWERLVVWMHQRFRKKHIWDVDIANVGTDITRLPEFRWADVIHLHWVNQGFLSLKDIERILDSGKRVLWTLHDQWPTTAVCHYAANCNRFTEHCSHCPQMQSTHERDLAWRIFERKRSLYQKINRITFIGCSEWICQEARKSALLRGVDSERVNGSMSPCRVVHIPNTIDQSVFRPTDSKAARLRFGLPLDRKLLLFSSLKVTDERKGVRYLLEACCILADQHPEESSAYTIVMVGKQSALQQSSSIPIISLPYMSDECEMALLYAAIDVFVTPSLQDNLPNTIVEAMSVGTPCVAFAVGGIPEMIHHLEDGFLATPRDAQSLADGIRYVLADANHGRLAARAASFAARTYSPERVVRQYISAL
ncbi:MAG: glycosyltransferase [Bacteroidales bacterium]|nr:glycosyltransferase [Candidatus Physcousia equi]